MWNHVFSCVLFWDFKKKAKVKPKTSSKGMGPQAWRRISMGQMTDCLEVIDATRHCRGQPLVHAKKKALLIMSILLFTSHKMEGGRGWVDFSVKN